MSVIQLNKHLKNNRDKMIQGKKCASVNLTIVKNNIFKNINIESLFSKKKIVLFSSPGAFSETSSKKQLPDFENSYDKLLSLGINDVYCISVNDSFVMNAWAEKCKLQKIKVLPDGNGDFTRSMGMLIEKKNIGFGLRSWRYSAIINDCIVEKWWQEDGMNNEGEDTDPYLQTTPENCIHYLSKTSL